MATESELRDLLGTIGDYAPAPQDTLDRLALSAAPVAPRARRWLPISAAVVAAAASVVVTVAVRGDDPQRNDSGASYVPRPTVDHATYPLPLDAYYASATQERTLQRAQFVLAQRCARTRGVVVPTARIPAGDPRPGFLSTLANDVRPLTLAQARTIGYDLYPSGTSAVDAALVGLTPAQLKTFQGCFGQAARTLLKGATPVPVPGETSTNGPGLFDDDVTMNNVYLNAARSGENSSAMQQAQRRWSVCMAAHGYPGHKTTQDLIEGLGDLQSVSAKREAVRDVQCKQATGFMTVWVASMTISQKAVIAAHRSPLAGFKKRLATRMVNAARALR